MSNNFRPTKFSDVVGNEVNNKLLVSIAKSNSAPSTYIFCGGYGCGKTTCSRILAKAVNCSSLTDDICGQCDSCKRSFDNDPCYSEFDSSLFGRVDNIRELYEELTFVPKGKKRVVCIDEAHLVTKQAQAALLKVFEDAPSNIYYVLCTTNKDALLSTIISRSLVLNFNTKSKEEVIANLNKIASENNIQLSNAAANLIALRSKGHMRDAHKLLEKYMLIGESDFLNLEESGYTYLAKYFAQVLWLIKNQRAAVDDIQKHKKTMFEIVERLMRIPVALLKDDYQRLFLDLAKKSLDNEYTCEPIIEKFVAAYTNRQIMDLYKVALDDFMMSSFDSDIRFQTALLSIYQRLLVGV